MIFVEVRGKLVYIMLTIYILVLHFVVALATPDIAKWDQLAVTFPKYTPVPHNENEAQRGGWVLLSDDCLDTTSPFRGRRYFVNNDRSLILIYDSHGHIAGLQLSYPAELKQTKEGKYQPAFVYKKEFDGGYYYVTAYFTEPGKICCYCSVRDMDVIGDKLIFLNDKTSRVVVPMTVESKKNMTSKKWMRGKCFPNMGLHFWYDQHKDTSCKDIFPFFTIYNAQGQLHAFGMGIDIVLKSDRYEYANPAFLGRFMGDKVFPTCLKDQNIITPTMHVFFTKVSSYTHGCTGADDQMYT